MKGLVFTEFSEMVEEKFGDEMLEQLFEDCGDDGVFVATDTYDFTRLVSLVVALSKHSGIEVSVLIEAFGYHLAGVFKTKFASFFEEHNTSVSMLKAIDDHIHVEVKKLYPKAELPKFDYVESNGEFKINYESARPFAPLALGLIRGVVDVFEETYKIEYEDRSEGRGTKATFYLRGA